LKGEGECLILGRFLPSSDIALKILPEGQLSATNCHSLKTNERQVNPVTGHPTSFYFAATLKKQDGGAGRPHPQKAFFKAMTAAF